MYRINVLLKQEQKLFHTRDLALLWDIKKPNTLYTTIKRYVQKGILVKIHKGFYATLPLEEIEPVRLGMSYLHTYAYLSCESVLAENGLIFQKSPYFTLISSLSKKFALAGHHYLVRQLKPEFLHQPIGIETKNGLLVATPERAAADLLYFNPVYHFDQRQTLNWSKVKAIQKEVGYT